jgi:uncharacterized protein (TIGR00730 family)
MKRVCIFCGSSPGGSFAYAEAAAAMGRLLAQEGIEVVTGGGRVGLMGAVADGALAAGGVVHGVIPHALVARELQHTGLTHAYVVDTMHERKQQMADLAEGFIALPGGMGTLDELCEILSWAQLGVHEKPVALLNLNGYFAGYLGQLEHAVREQFMKAKYLEMVLVGDSPQAVLAAMRAYRPLAVTKWIDRRTV